MQKATFKRKFLWWFRSFVKETRMGKYKAILRYFYDTAYRRDINHLMELLCWGKLHMRTDTLRLGDIHHSHAVNYPDWVLRLVQQERACAYLPLIKVYYDDTQDKYLVIDGNHRLAAMNLVYDRNHMVQVNVLHRDPVASPEPYRYSVTAVTE